MMITLFLLASEAKACNVLGSMCMYSAWMLCGENFCALLLGVVVEVKGKTLLPMACTCASPLGKVGEDIELSTTCSSMLGVVDEDIEIAMLGVIGEDIGLAKESQLACRPTPTACSSQHGVVGEDIG